MAQAKDFGQGNEQGDENEAMMLPVVAIGEVFGIYRGRTQRRYRVVRFEKFGVNDVVLASEDGREERAVSWLLIARYGWHKVGSA